MTDATPDGMQVPSTGLAAMRIGLEFGSSADFVDSLERALARGGEQPTPEDWTTTSGILEKLERYR